MRFTIISLILIAAVAIFYFAGKGEDSPAIQAQKIIDAAILQHGADQFAKSVVEFDFRDRHYRATRDGGKYTYERILEDSIGITHDSLSNDGFVRRINGEVADITEKKKASYSNSVNSVIYFALLPYFLNDAAVNKTYLGEATIKGENYDKIKVTFEQEGGGKDFEDEFIYWFHQNNKTMDYLAYNYRTEGGGARFRVAYNTREIQGIRFADYINLKPKDKANLAVETFDSLYNAGELVELSRIDSENVKVKLQ